MRLKRLSVKRFLPLLFLVILIISFWKFNPFLVKEVKVETKNINCATSEDIKANVKLEGKVIFLINDEQVNRQILDNFSCISLINIQKSFLGNITILTEGRTPKLKVASYRLDRNLSLKGLEATPSSTSALIDWSLPTSSEDNIVVDNEGVVLNVEESNSLPIVYIPFDNLAELQKIDNYPIDKISSIFEELQKVESVKSDNLAGKVVGDTLLIQTETKLMFNLERDISRQVTSLQLILSKAKMDNKVIKSVDLRFDKPVVTY